MNAREGTVCKANLKLRESSFELVKSESSSELKTEASNIRTLF